MGACYCQGFCVIGLSIKYSKEYHSEGEHQKHSANIFSRVKIYLMANMLWNLKMQGKNDRCKVRQLKVSLFKMHYCVMRCIIVFSPTLHWDKRSQLGQENICCKKVITRWDTEAGAGLPRHFLIEFLRQWAESRSAHWHNFALLIQIKCFCYAQTLKKLSTPPYRPVSFSKEWKANDFHQNKK